MSAPTTPGTLVPLATGTWRLDPTRSRVEFHVPNAWGLTRVHGRFERFAGTLDLAERPAVALTVDAASVETGNARRDTHLRSAAFFATDEHPEVRFEADAAHLAGRTLRMRGLLYAAGRHIPLTVHGDVLRVGDEFEVEATALVDQRELGMTFSPLGSVRRPSRLTLHGVLVPSTT